MNEEALFAAALDKHDPAERQAFLDEACAGDDRLRLRLERLLAADDRDRDRGILAYTVHAPPFLDAFRPEPKLAAAQVFADRFLLRQKLGEGGMGEVWAADQQAPVRRRVALKVIRPGLASARTLLRFEQERQALALMNHPNIAKVLEAGVVGARPYFVMELIEGTPLIRYCDEAKLTLRERLHLFLPVCEAVRHAHQKGIIHRDLKPSNILVESHDGKPVPKVIDFGLAKPTGQPPSGHNVSTEVGTLVGTPEYMSPEQADANNLDLDTRSDIYALGVLLYELLTGGVPHSRQELQSFAFVEMLRVIREVEPPPPSARLAPAPAALVRGELDWIVMKCLEKDPARRYQTANELAADVRRYLADEPVLAGPPSRGYRVRKFLRRHRGAVLAASLVLLALVGGVVGTTLGLLGESKRAEGERQAKEVAEKRLSQVEKGIDALGSIFENLDPRAEEKEGRPLRVILGDRLDQVAADLQEDAVGDPLVVARLQDRLGRTYLSLGHTGKAEALFAKAVATRHARLGPDDPLTLQSRAVQAKASHLAGRPREAIQQLEQVLATQTSVLEADHPDILTTLSDLGRAHWLAGDATKAVPLLERVRNVREKHLGEDHADTLAALHNLGGAYLTAQRHAESIVLCERVLAARVRKHGETHPLALASLNSLAHAYQAGYKMKQALDLFERARNDIVPKLGEYDPQTLVILANLAHMYGAFGRMYPERGWTAKAIALGEVVLERRVMILGTHHQSTLLTVHQVALAYQAAGNLDKALPLFQQTALGIEKLEFAQYNFDVMIQNLCYCHEQMKRYDLAEVWWRKLLPIVKAKAGPESLAYAEELGHLGANLLEQKKYADAQPILREGLILLQKHAPQGWKTFDAQSLLGAAHLGQRKYADAEPLLLEGYRGLKRLAGEGAHPHHGTHIRERQGHALSRLVQLYDAWGKPHEAARWRKES